MISLYREEKYDEALDLYDFVVQQKIWNKIPGIISIPAAAVCYKLNTEASYQKLSEMYKAMVESGQQPNDRVCQFFVALAINQGFPNVALDVLGSRTRNVNFFVNKNLIIQAYCDMGKPMEALKTLEYMKKDWSVCKETIEKLRVAVDKSEDASLSPLLHTIETALVAEGGARF